MKVSAGAGEQAACVPCRKQLTASLGRGPRRMINHIRGLQDDVLKAITG
ncbi:hypothetical protein AWB69_03059 [Caballeronia udeis]|uniref:Uncharacterized protein n=1 Tax=Caballeronia udeis TaxID=1232866 RepID=A0A158GQP7_9BURK|nr:hypothetical protein AWB69_03059 [Caballeronia udeis]